MAILYVFPFIASLLFLYHLLTKKIISRRNPDEAPKSKFDIVKVDNGNLGSQARPGGIDVVFVHGLGSNPDTTWTAKAPPGSSKDQVCWVTDFLPADIPPQLRDDVRLYFCNHNTFWKRDAVQVELVDLGEDLLQNLRTIRRHQDEDGRYLILVGHSYGGLVIKQALVHANQDRNYTDIITHTKAILFLGTPHKGSSFSFWGRIVANILLPIGSNPSIMDGLIYDSPHLHELHKRFTQAAVDVKSIVNFYERYKTPLFKLWWFQWGAFCVRKQSATYSGNPNQVKDVGLGVDHYGLNKFGSKNEEYDLIFKALLDVIIPVITELQRHIYSVPIKPLRSYIQRESLLQEIEAKLQQSSLDRARPYAAAICGAGGTGKTQLVLDYVEKHKDHFNTILWIDAENQERALADFTRCAYSLDIPVSNTSKQSLPLGESIIVQAVRQWLQSRKKSDGEWLVVFDNVDTMAGSIFDVLPVGQQGNIIIISQNEQSSRLLKDCEKVSVDIMSPLEARSLLSWHLKLDYYSQRQELENLCDELAGSLGYLPLAVDLAGVYMGNETDPRFALHYYKKHQKRLLRNSQYNGLSSYRKTVWTVWDAALLKIEGQYQNRHAKLLLILLAHFPDGIVHEEVFRLASLELASTQQHTFADLPEWLKLLLAIDGEEWDDFPYRQACEPLINYGLLRPVEGKGPGIRVHTLVQWRALQYKEDQNQDAWDKWHMQFMLLACHGALRHTAWPQLQRIPFHALDMEKGFKPEHWLSSNSWETYKEAEYAFQQLHCVYSDCQ